MTESAESLRIQLDAARAEIERLGTILTVESRALLDQCRRTEADVENWKRQCEAQRLRADRAEAKIERMIADAEDTARRIPSPFADNVVRAVRGAARAALATTGEPGEQR